MMMWFVWGCAIYGLFWMLENWWNERERKQREEREEMEARLKMCWARERRQREEQHRQTEEKLEKLIAHASSGAASPTA